MPAPAAQPFAFDPATHTYTLAGRKLPSVTQILRAEGFIDDTGWNEFAMKRGSAVHEATLYYDEGRLDWGTVDPRIRGYLMAYIRFLGETGFKPRLMETPLASAKLGYAGTFDRLGALADAETLLDFKSGSAGYKPWHDLQLGAYHGLIRENRDALGLEIKDMPRRHFVLQLMEDATYKLHPMKSQASEAIACFLAALTTFNWKQKRGIHDGAATSDDGETEGRGCERAGADA